MKREADRVRERKEGTNKHSNFSFNASRTGRRVFEHDRPSRLPAAACYAPPATRAKLSSPSKRAFTVRDEEGAERALSSVLVDNCRMRLLSHFCPLSSFCPTSVQLLSHICPISVLCPAFVVFLSLNFQFCPDLD